MSSFTEDLTVTKLRHRDLWVTARAFEYYTNCDDGDAPLQQRCRTVISVPAGVETDFASIPRLFWPVIGHPADQYAQAAVLHDWLYRMHTVSRKRADELFLEAMEVLGVAAWRRRVMWLAVRLGGSSAYAASAEAAIDQAP